MTTFEQFLSEKFIGQGEFKEIPIIKDNFEDLFDQWLSELDGQEYMDFAEEWGQELKAEIAKDVEKIGDLLTGSMEEKMDTQADEINKENI